MEREIKIWGSRFIIRRDTTHETSILHIFPNYRCSWHYHKTKWNTFFVISGVLIITVKELGDLRTIVLKENETVTIRPGVEHEFEAGANDDTITIVLEEMFVKYDEHDIIRERKGGKA